MNRRRAQTRLFFALGAAGLSACGFQLRQWPTLPFRTLAFAGFAPNSPLAGALKRELALTGVSVLDTPSRADAVLEALTDAREKTVAASTAAGQVRELQLRTRLRFRVATPAGKLLLAPVELLLTRDLSYSETAALGKAQEETQIYRAMDDDIVGQVIQRLAAIKAA
jgi:LPS-assembly lipoprotein